MTASLDLIVTYSWTLLSGVFVLLAIYGIVISSQEDRDTKAELLAQRERSTPNGVLILGLQQADQSGNLKKMHRYALVHQLAGFLIGAISLYHLLIGDREINTPTTQIERLEELFVPVLALALVFCVCAVQFNLIRVTWGQRKARLNLRALEMQDEDAMKDLAREISERMGRLEVQAGVDRAQQDLDRGEEQLEREASRQERTEAGVDRDESEVDRDEARPHRGTARDERELAQDERQIAQDEREERQDERERDERDRE